MECWHWYDENYVPEERHAAAVLREQGGEGNTVWYADFGATDHITNELEKLAIREKYFGNDQVHTAASGGGMNIHHIGQASISSPISKRDILLKDVLHVPQANKNLAPMSCLTADNNVFFETHPKYFCYKGSIPSEYLLYVVNQKDK